jgi:hypothetical protein
MASNAPNAPSAFSASKALAALAAALTLSFAACSGDDYEDTGDPTAVVYSAGIDASYRATVWERGGVLRRFDAESILYSVWVSASAPETVYAAGQAPNGRPFYWSSGSPDALNYLGSGEGEATAVCVSGGQVYVAGADAAGGKVWRDGQQLYSLPAGSMPWAMAVAGNTVYTAGDDHFGACIWRNGEQEPIDFLDGEDGDAPVFWSVGVSGSVVYAAGQYEDCPVWIRTGDPVVHYLGAGEGSASSLHLSGGNIYIAGHDAAGGKVWWGPAGGAMGNTVGLGAGAYPESVFALGGAVYSGGSAPGGGMVWKNSERLYGLGANNDVLSVFAVERAVAR